MIKGGKGRCARDITEPDLICTLIVHSSRNKEKFIEEYPNLYYIDIKRFLEDMWEIMDEDMHKYY